MTVLQAIRDFGRVAVRGSVFFVTNLRFGVAMATRAWLVDTAFRIPLVGISGAIDQVLADAAPVWAATAVVMIAVLVASRAIEALTHWIAGTPELLVGLFTSLAFSAVSNPLTLCAMRHGALVVGANGEDSLVRDPARLPRIVADAISSLRVRFCGILVETSSTRAPSGVSHGSVSRRADAF